MKHWVSGRLRTGRSPLVLILALTVSVIGDGRPALARDSRAETLDAARALVARSGLDCSVVDASRIYPEPPAEGGRRRGGGRMGDGGVGGGGIGAGGMGGGLSAGEAPEGGLAGGNLTGGGMSRQGSGAEGAPFSRDRSAPLGYEVACQDRLGLVILAPSERHRAGQGQRASGEQADAAPPPDYLNCLEADAAAGRLGASFRCRLKENRDRVAPLQALASHAGLDCAVSRVRGLGHTETRSFFELACAKGAKGDPPKLSDTGFVLITSRAMSADGTLAAAPCFDTQANPHLRCELTNVGPIIEALHRSIARSAPDCVAASQRLVGLSQAGGRVFEIACRDGSGYLLRLTDDGAADPPVACSEPAVAGRCRLAKAPAAKPL